MIGSRNAELRSGKGKDDDDRPVSMGMSEHPAFGVSARSALAVLADSDAPSQNLAV